MHTDPRVANTTVHRHDNPSLEIAVRSLRSPTGEGREENQDNFLLIDEQGYARFLKEEQETWLQVPNWPRGHRRLVLLDGMGGHHYGRQAAESAVEGLIGLPAVSNRDQLCVELTQLHQRLYQEFQQAGMCTGCTLVLLEIPVDAPALLFHVGEHAHTPAQQRLAVLRPDRARQHVVVAGRVVVHGDADHPEVGLALTSRLRRPRDRAGREKEHEEGQERSRAESRDGRG